MVKNINYNIIGLNNEYWIMDYTGLSGRFIYSVWMYEIIEI